MKSKQDRPARRFAQTSGNDVSHKLRKIVTDIHEGGNASITRLTVLKKWFEVPNRLRSFGVFIASTASSRGSGLTDETAALFCEAREVLAGVDVFSPNIPRARAESLHASLEAFQNERKNIHWTSVRMIRSVELFLVEGGLHLYLWRGASSTDGYRLTAAYCEHYDPRHGNGLNGPSVYRIEDIIVFIRAFQAQEQA